MGLPQLMVNQRYRFAHQAIQVNVGHFRGGSTREVQQRIDDLAGPESLFGNLFQQNRLLHVATQLLGQHLGIGGDNGERRVDFMRYASGQQADGAKLIGLHQLALEFRTLRDVVEQDDAADLMAVF